MSHHHNSERLISGTLVQLTPSSSQPFPPLSSARNPPGAVLQPPLFSYSTSRYQLLSGTFYPLVRLSFLAVRHVTSPINHKPRVSTTTTDRTALPSICFRPSVAAHAAPARSTFPARIQILLLQAPGHPRLPALIRRLQMLSRRGSNDNRNENV